MAKLTQKQRSDLRGAFLARREELLIGKVNALAVKLFEKVFDQYLIELEKSDDGNLVNSSKNTDLIKGLDEIYKNFNLTFNIPVVKGFVTDLQAIGPVNEAYFKSVVGREVRDSLIKVQAVVNKRIGVDAGGKLKPGGFADKFIKDKTLLKTIKQTTAKAITNKMGFQEFRETLKKTIQGNPEQKLSGGLQQYYRNYAYDTFMKVDRLNQDLFAKDLGLRYFYWSGGVIKTTRPICFFCNGKLVDSEAFKVLKYEDIKSTLAENGGGNLVPFNSGLDANWVPLDDLGENGCRHRKDYVPDIVAKQHPERLLNVDNLLA